MNIMKNLFAKLLLISAFLLFLGGGYLHDAQAQNTTVTVTGKVLDSGNQPLAGAVVLVKGTTRGATTTADGSFTIRAKQSDALVFSMLGYAEQEIVIGQRTSLTVNLQDEASAIDEVVIEVGYGTQAKKDITGTVSMVKIEDALKAPVVNFEESLAGRVAGVQISSADGQPGQEMDIVIRGANSLTQSNSPLYVVDGFPMEDFSASAINSNDIESFTILKDASATAIYGARGANGVIIIETKKGQEGKATITYNGNYGFQQVANTMDMMNAAQFVEYQIERSSANADKYLNIPGRTMEDYKAMGEGISWQDKLFRNAPIQMHNVSLTGGTKQTKYAASISVADQEGVILNSGYQKYQGRFSLTQQLNKKARLQLQVSYTSDKTYGQTASEAQATSNAYASYLMYRTWAYRPVNTNPAADIEEELFDDVFDGSASATMNPIISVKNEHKESRRRTFMSTLRFDYTLMKGLKLTMRGGYTTRQTLNTQFNNSKTYAGYPNINNVKGVHGSVSDRTDITWMNENTLNYNKNWGNGRHKLDAVLGFTVEGKERETYGFSAYHVPVEEHGMNGIDNGVNHSMTSSTSDSYLMSWLGRVNYSFLSRYMLTMSFRADGSSKFSENNRWGYFPSAAFAWRVGEEKFLRNVRFINDWKIRASYGMTGNNRVSDYASWATIALSDYYSFGNIQPGYVAAPSTLGNRDLKWETTEQIDIGTDIRLFKNRVSLTVDWYQKTTRDLLLNANLPTNSGYPSVYKNIGKVRNRGLEFSLSTVNIRTKDFEWTSDFNISFNRSKVLALSEGEETLLSTTSFTADFNATYLYMAKVGQPVAQFYGVAWDGVYGYDDFDIDALGNYVLKKGVPSNGHAREEIQPGDIKYVDQNGDGLVNDLDMVVIGRCEPLHEGGFNNTFTYKGLSLGVFFQWRYGYDVMNANRIMFEGNYASKSINQFASYADHWTPQNTDSQNFRVGGQGPKGVYSSRTIEDASFLRLKTLSLSYTLPRKVARKLHMRTVQFTLSAQNLFTWTDYSGLDPEVSVRNSALTPGFDYSAYARNKVYTAGLKLVF